MMRQPRPVTTILAELADVRRHLQDAPPHHGGGAEALRRRLDHLQAELTRARGPGREDAAQRERPSGA